MRAGNCRHFNGMMNETCDVGVSYSELTEAHRFSPPCYVSSRTDDREKVVCAKYSPLSPEEVETEEREFKERMKFTLEARRRCVEDSERQEFKLKVRGVEGTVECPKCQGKLQYSRSEYNGHIWAKCDTKECLQWIE